MFRAGGRAESKREPAGAPPGPRYMLITDRNGIGPDFGAVASLAPGQSDVASDAPGQ